MLLLLVLSTAVIFYPALSQPARSEIFDESDYPVPFYRARGEWGEPMERPHKGIDVKAMGKGSPTTSQMPERIPKNKPNEEGSTKEKLFKWDAMLNRLNRRQFMVDPIGGGYLLRRESGRKPVTKRTFPLDPIGGGYLLKRSQDDQNENLSEMSYENLDGKPRRSPGSGSPMFIRLIPKEDIAAALTDGNHYLNDKNLHLVGTGLDMFPIDPIGGGLLLGRSISYDNVQRKPSGKEEYMKHDIAHMIKDLEAMRFSNVYPQQGRSGKLVDSSGVPFKAGKRMIGAGKRNFDEIDRSGFNGFVKKNFDEIDRSGFNSLVKKNFDEIDRNGFNGFVKKNINRFETLYR